MRPLTLYAYVPQGYHAAFPYRIFTPLHTARDLGLPVRAHIDTNLAGIDMEQRIKAMFESDIILLYQPIGEPTWYNLRAAKSFMPSKVDGTWKWPPSVVIDTDDNLFGVTPYNAAFKTLGIRDHNGKDIPSGHTIGVVQGGQKKVLWKDGENGFDLAANRHNLDTYRNMIDLSDAVTCTTPRVAESVRQDASPRRVEVFPNLVRFSDYEQVKIEQDPTRLNILWQGGASHYEDWYPLREQLGNITRKYKHVHWIIWGQLYHWVTELIPPERYTFINWCPYSEYKLRLVMMNHQINLAPLTPNRFNNCRSAIKFYEGSVLRRPAATLAQNTGPYADEILDGETALLFNTPEEFETQLSTMIEDESLRLRLASNAKDWVSQHRDAFKHVPKQVAFWESLREAEKLEQPHMPESQWEEFAKNAQTQMEVEVGG